MEDREEGRYRGERIGKKELTQTPGGDGVSGANGEGHTDGVVAIGDPQDLACWLLTSHARGFLNNPSTSLLFLRLG